MTRHIDSPARTDRPAGLKNFEEAARYLGVTPRFVQKLVATRRIPHRKLGRLVRFADEDLDQYLDAVRKSAANPA